MFNNLEAEQARNNYTNLDMANRLNMSRKSYENKKKSGKFNRPEIVALLKLFDVKFEYLFDTDKTE